MLPIGAEIHTQIFTIADSTYDIYKNICKTYFKINNNVFDRWENRKLNFFI